MRTLERSVNARELCVIQVFVIQVLLKFNNRANLFFVVVRVVTHSTKSALCPAHMESRTHDQCEQIRSLGSNCLIDGGGGNLTTK